MLFSCHFQILLAISEIQLTLHKVHTVHTVKSAVSLKRQVGFINDMKKMAGPQPHRFARLKLARLGLNDGAKLWVSFKLNFKTNDFYSTYWRIVL